MLNKEKRQRCASILTKDPEMVQFLYEMFAPDKSKLRNETEKNVLALNDEDYGRAMKVLFMTEAHFLSVLAEIKQIAGTSAGEKKVPHAPK